MDIFVDKIPAWATQEDVEAQIAEALHTAPVRRPGQELTNFAVKLAKKCNGTPTGHAYLIIPQVTTADRFVQKCGRGRKERLVTLTKDDRTCVLDFKINGLAKPHQVQKLIDEPYLDPQTRRREAEQRRQHLQNEAKRLRETLPLREEARRAAQEQDCVSSLFGGQRPDESFFRDVADVANAFAQATRRQPKRRSHGACGRAIHDSEAGRDRSGTWKTIAFGVVCPDGSFSVEDEERLSIPLPATFSEYTQTLIFGDETNDAVKILYNTLLRWSNHEKEVTFELERPATFIRNGRVSAYWGFTPAKSEDAILVERQRYRAPHVGSIFKIVFTTHEELEAFWRLGQRVFARAGRPVDARRCVKRNLFKPAYFERIEALCAGLSIPLAFQCERLFRNDLLLPPAIDDLEGLVHRSIQERGERATALLVMNVSIAIQRHRATRATDNAKPFDLPEAFLSEAERLSRAKHKVEDLLLVGLGATFEVYNVTVTPTRTLLAGPVVDTSNRVLRLFPDKAHHFLRVAFTDEDFDRFPVCRRDLRGADSESFVHERIGGTLKDGIVVAGRKWDMLAWSSSSIRSHQCWFATPFTDDDGKRWTADLIRQALGDFSTVETIPARYGARLSQAFSATAPTVPLQDEWVEVIDDVRSSSGHLFTDGVGQISPELMEMVWSAYCRLKMLSNGRQPKASVSNLPSAIQIRIGGAKGVLCVNPCLAGPQLKLRPSMIKFEASHHNDIEVTTSSLLPLPTRLNRPLINALEDLGIDRQSFMVLQRQAIEDVNQARFSFRAAAELCGRYDLGSSVGAQGIFDALHCLVGFSPAQIDATGILNRLIGTSISTALGDLKRKARIPVRGTTLIGVADEFGFLRKNQVFAQVLGRNGRLRIIEGEVLIGRSPTIHPADTRMVRAVVPPRDHPLWKLRNVVVFSCDGKGRSLPSMLGGGDLDGDFYSLYEEPRLFIKRNYTPREYKQPPNKALNRPCTSDDLAEFFTEFVINDQIGLISHLHLHISDRSPQHSLDRDCFKLAALHSQAVDFCKTGQPVYRRDLPSLPINCPLPDYLAQNDDADNVYQSRRALGHLYREIAWTDTNMPQGPHRLWFATDSRCPPSSSPAPDLVAVLETIAERFPYACPASQELESAMQERFMPLLHSFTYHLSHIAAWVPNSRHAVDWLREEEIILGTPLMATTSKVKRRQERLQSAMTELMSILKHQLGVIATGGGTDPQLLRPTMGKADLETRLELLELGVGRGTLADAAARQMTVPNSPLPYGGDDGGDDEDSAALRRCKTQVEAEIILEAVTHPVEGVQDDMDEIQALFAACRLGATDARSRAFGGDTFALVALGALLDLVGVREKRSLQARRQMQPV
ncbi:hypothetical protein ACQY0O_006919 [Thecaphora frezii]